MERYEKKEITKQEEVLSGIICDNCTKEVKGDIYFSVNTSHILWGNDSIDSLEYSEFCSYECTEKHMKEYFKNPKKTIRYEVEIEKTPKK